MSHSSKAPPPGQVGPLLATAAQCLSARRPADAIAPLREAARLQPADATIQHDLGLACLEVGFLPEAIAAFQRAVSLNPRYADGYFRMGIALEKLGDMRAAVAAYDRATALLPTRGDIGAEVGIRTTRGGTSAPGREPRRRSRTRFAPDAGARSRQCPCP